jgi:hypothetical protein
MPQYHSRDLQYDCRTKGLWIASYHLF